MQRHVNRTSASAASGLLAVMGVAAVLVSAAPVRAISETALAVPLAGIRLDGDLSDWPRGMPTQRILNHFDVYGRTDLAGEDLTQSDDLTPVMMVGYDANTDFLYLAVEVRDDVNHNPRHPNHLQSDGLEIYVSGLAGDSPSQQPTKYVMVPGDHQFAGFAGNPALANGVIGRTRTRSVWRRQGDVTTYEWQIDVFDRPGQRTELNPGEVIGLDVVVVDHDGPGSGNAAWVPWGPAVGNKWTSNDRIGRILLGGGPLFGSGSSIEPKDLVRSVWGARMSNSDIHRNAHDEDIHVAVHGVASLVAGILDGVQEATNDESVIEWMRQEGASEEDLAQLRVALQEAQAELADAHVELQQELIGVDVRTDIQTAMTQARVSEAIAMASNAEALAAAEAREIRIPDVLALPAHPVAPEIVAETDNSDFINEVVWSSFVGLALLIGAIGVTVILARRSGQGAGADPELADRIERIEQRLTDTQDVMIALSEKLDRLDDKTVQE